FQTLRVAIGIGEIAALVVPAGRKVSPNWIASKLRKDAIFDSVFMFVQEDEHFYRPRISQLTEFDDLTFGRAWPFVSIQIAVHGVATSSQEVWARIHFRAVRRAAVKAYGFVVGKEHAVLDVRGVFILPRISHYPGA